MKKKLFGIMIWLGIIMFYIGIVLAFVGTFWSKTSFNYPGLFGVLSVFGGLGCMILGANYS